MSNTASRNSGGSKKVKANLPDPVVAETAVDQPQEEISKEEGVGTGVQEKSPVSFAEAAEQANLPADRSIQTKPEDDYSIKRTKEGMWAINNRTGGILPKGLNGSFTSHQYAKDAIAAHCEALALEAAEQAAKIA